MHVQARDALRDDEENSRREGEMAQTLHGGRGPTSAGQPVRDGRATVMRDSAVGKPAWFSL